MRSHLLFLALFCSTCTYCKGGDSARPCPEPAPCPAASALPVIPPPAPGPPPVPTTVVKEPVCEAPAEPPEPGAHRHRVPRLPAFPWRLAASHALKARVTATPLSLGQDRWAVVDHQGRVHALTVKKEKDRWTIRVAWTTKAGKDALWSPPALSADGRVLWVGSDDDQVYRLDAATGALLGQARPFTCAPRKATDPEAARCDQDTSPLPLPDGGVLVGGAGLAALDAAGAALWTHPVASHLRGAPARDLDGGLYAVTLGGEILALTAAGRPRWQARARGGCDATPLLAGGCTLLVGCDDRTLTAHSTLDGHARWRLHAPEGFRGGGALSPDGATVYWGNLDRHVYAVETATGKVRWRYRTAGRHLLPPLVDADGRVLAFPEERQLYLLAPDGTLAGVFQLPAVADAHPARLDDRTWLLPLETGELLLLEGP